MSFEIATAEQLVIAFFLSKFFAPEKKSHSNLGGFRELERRHGDRVWPERGEPVSSLEAVG